MWREWDRREKHTGLLRANLNERNSSEHLAVTESIILKWMINEYGEYGIDSSGLGWELVITTMNILVL